MTHRRVGALERQRDINGEMDIIIKFGKMEHNSHVAKLMIEAKSDRCGAILKLPGAPQQRSPGIEGLQILARQSVL